LIAIFYLLVTSTSDLLLSIIEFCSVLFAAAYSLMRGGLCSKQTCTELLYTTAPTNVNCLSHCSSHRSLFVQNRDLCQPHLHLTPPLGGPWVGYTIVWSGIHEC